MEQKIQQLEQKILELEKKPQMQQQPANSGRSYLCTLSMALTDL